MKLDELASRSGVSARTVRYYIQRGLLPAPEFRGPDTAYDEGHLARLRAIRSLQERHLPLEEIAVELARRFPSGVAAGAASPPMEAKQASAPAAESRAERRRVAPGVELLIDDDAPPWARALADEMTELARRGRRGR